MNAAFREQMDFSEQLLSMPCKLILQTQNLAAEVPDQRDAQFQQPEGNPSKSVLMRVSPQTNERQALFSD